MYHRDTLRDSQWPTRGRGDPDAPFTDHRPATRLSAHERAFLVALANGYTARVIAAEAGVSVAYVDKASRNIKTKLGALNLPHAIALAFVAGWLRPEDIEPT